MMIKINKALAMGLLFVGLSGCVSQPKDLSKELDNSDYLKDVDSSAYSGEVFGDGNIKPKERADAEYYPGTGEFINYDSASRVKPAVTSEGEVTFNFEGQSLQAVIHFILGEVLKENYVIAPGVSGKVTFATAKPVSKKQIIPILEMMLSWNKAALVMAEGRYHVLPEGQAIKGLLTPKLNVVNQGGGYQVLAVPLTFVSPSEMEKLLEPYAKAGAVIKADNARNILFLSGTNSELSNYLETIETFDVDWLAGMSTGIFYLKQVESADILTELEALFGEGAENPLAGMFRFLPLERLNAIMVITPQEDYLHQAKQWVDRLDRADSDGASNLYVYSVKNIKADDLASYLNDVFGGSSGSSSASRRADGGSVTPGQTGREVSSNGARNTNTTTRRTPRNNTAGSGINEIFISAIEDSNQLLIKAGVVDYEKILSAIERLDIEPRQVLVEMKIIEVTLNNSVTYGMDLLFGDGAPALDGGSTDGDTETKSAPYDFSTTGARINNGGIAYRFLGTDAQARFDALEAAGRIAFISTPSLLVLNNKNATINVGDQIPITNVGTINNGTTGSISSTRFIQTGVQVDITPRVNPGGLVYMEVSQDVSNPIETATEGATPQISTRALTTEIAVQSGDTIVMGGLIRENDTKTSAGVPVLSRIPVLGNIFGRKVRSNNRTELMLLITPTVVENPEQARQITQEYAKKFRGLKPINVNEDKNKENDE